ncbi:hypothetical protein FVF58_04150 [Paraburkholderia panacisoli]|uniref:TubC N-terminal docking domain-containing protein n=1 Tax=Paraburkholderia panacisoli TaxID=2603818 RepID=A0A5B0HJ17_9BURK|nr:hypothetical protein [Paraburkholderia panacisoli]KAA1015120.1 hypothetical protein FVF58_04150 [Paraburkholderia panacisoli]
MNAGQILSKAQTMGVRLSLNGDVVKMKGPASAIATIKPEIAAHKSAIVAHLQAAAGVPADSIGALIDPNGGVYLPWGPYLSADDVQRMRTELLAMIEQLAALEGWPHKIFDDVMERAVRGPLSDLLPNLSHFHDRITGLKAERDAREVLNRRTWDCD